MCIRYPHTMPEEYYGGLTFTAWKVMAKTDCHFFTGYWPIFVVAGTNRPLQRGVVYEAAKWEDEDPRIRDRGDYGDYPYSFHALADRSEAEKLLRQIRNQGIHPKGTWTIKGKFYEESSVSSKDYVLVKVELSGLLTTSSHARDEGAEQFYCPVAGTKMKILEEMRA